MKKMNKSAMRSIVGGGLNWQCRTCGMRGWGVFSSFMHNMIPGHHRFWTW